MATRSSNAFWWALIGFFLGVAATLAAVIAIGGGDGGADSPEAKARRAALTPPAPSHRALRPATGSPADEAPAISDQQVAEDAAAAGMTSRTRAPSADPQ
jgi:hypothetical protein